MTKKAVNHHDGQSKSPGSIFPHPLSDAYLSSNCTH